MPVEIHELQITTVVQESGSRQTQPSSPSATAFDREGIIAECVEQVMEILKQKNER